MAVDDEVKKEMFKKYQGKETAELVKDYFKLKDARSKADAKVEYLKSEGVVLTSVLIKQMQTEKASKFGVPKVGTVTLTTKNVFAIKKDDESEAFQTFKKNKNLKGLVKATVNFQSLQSAMNEYFEKNNKIPKGISMTTLDVINHTKAKK